MLIYSPNGAAVHGLTGHYRNPDYFERASPTDKVVLVGDYPHIKHAYEMAGVVVEQYQQSDSNSQGEVLENKPKAVRKPKAE